MLFEEMALTVGMKYVTGTAQYEVKKLAFSKDLDCLL